jgi:hypothetical protein
MRKPGSNLELKEKNTAKGTITDGHWQVPVPPPGGQCSESLLNPNAGTRTAEKTKTGKSKLLCHQLGKPDSENWCRSGRGPGLQCRCMFI